MTRFPISFEQNMSLKKGTWTPEEDRRLVSYIKKYGIWNWNEMPKYAGLLRSGKSCRLRWMNYLRPGIKRGNFTKEEEETIIRLHKVLGNRWAEIAQRMSQRTDNEIKNYWNTRLKNLAAEISSTADHEDHEQKIETLMIIDHEHDTLLSPNTSSLLVEVEDYISSPESSVFNSPAAGNDIYDFDCVFIKEEKNAENCFENVWGQPMVEVGDNDFIEEENYEAKFVENVYGEVLDQGLWEKPMLEEVVMDNSQNFIIDEDLMMMRAPSQQLWLYESTVLCDSYSPDDFWSSASI